MQSADMVKEGTGVAETLQTAAAPTDVASGGVPKTQTQKRVVKLTPRGYALKLETLQADRKSKLNKASLIRKSMHTSMVNSDKMQVENALKSLTEVCIDVNAVHESLMSLLPRDEKEKHETWFKAKMLFNNESIRDAKLWVSYYDDKLNDVAFHNAQPSDTVQKLSLPTAASNVVQQRVDDEVNPDDSISNVGSQCSGHRSHRGGMSQVSTTSSYRKQAEAERAALLARASALKERHALEEQEQQLRRRREELDLETDLAASTAKLNVLHAPEVQSCARAPSDGMNSYLARARPKQSIVLDPTAMEFNPEQTMMQQTSFIPNYPHLADERRKATEQWCEAVCTQWNEPMDLRTGGRTTTMQPASQAPLPYEKPLPQLPQMGWKSETEQGCETAFKQWHNLQEPQQTTNILSSLQPICQPTMAPIKKVNPPSYPPQGARHAPTDLFNVVQGCEAAPKQWYNLQGPQQTTNVSSSLQPTCQPTVAPTKKLHPPSYPPQGGRHAPTGLFNVVQDCEAAPKQWHHVQGPQQAINALNSLQPTYRSTRAPVKVHAPSYPPQGGTQAPADFLNVIHRQTEITATLVQQQNMLSLPPREIPVFGGDPLQYRAFIKAFEQGIERKAEQADCLYYLEQFTRGRPQELVRSCQHMAPDRGYIVARRLLKEHFGNPYKVATAYMERALAWQNLKSEDADSLQEYSLFLRGCCNVMEELPYVQELDMPVNMRTIISKLPFKMREQWRTKAHEIMETTGDRAHFSSLVAFIEKRVKVLSDPLFGDIQDSSGVGGKDNTKFKLQHRERAKGNVVATTVASMDPSESDLETSDLPTIKEEQCLCCGLSHALEKCKQFQRKGHKEKMSLLKERGACFACLSSGHLSRHCQQRLQCTVCGQRHPTVLHIQRHPTATEQEKRQASEELTSLKACSLTGAGKERCALSILPVKVKSAKGDRVIHTYAFLDSGSSATFCSEDLMRKLNVTGRKTSLLLRTMGQEKTVSAHSLTDLEITGLDNNDFHMLPEVFTQKEMPVTVEDMVKPGDLTNWPYLSKVHIPSIEANVDLLIGTNAPKIMEPWEVINSHGRGPYALKTVLGWVINGPLARVDDDEESEPRQFPVTVNRISLCKLERMLTEQYNHEFNDKASEEKELSREDHRFLEIAEQSAMLQEGRYSLKLPFKKKDLLLPNNFTIARQRMQGLKRKFLNNSDLHQEYTEYMNKIISKGHAEQVTPQQLSGRKGKLWYIPHHAVRHPRKGSLRVVFDCGASFQGACLNTELLQGPNLTSSLLGVLTRFREETVAFMGDIQAMFHQVKVHEEDRDFLRFLWWPEGDTTRDLVEYRMTVHLFGATSSPSCAAYALRKTGDDNQSECSSEVLQSITQNFYVDDYLKSSGTPQEASRIIEELTTLCLKGGFRMEKWISNSRVVLQNIVKEERAQDLKELDLDRDQLPVERALGLQWCVETDTFKFRMEMKQQPLTRRGMLSVTSSVYDPLGLLAPITLTAKIMQQELCRRKCSWDEELPSDLLRQWKGWLEELDLLATFNVARSIKPVNFGTIVHAQLHHFADASEDGYGTATYIRILNQSNDIQVSLLLGKARVTPLKAVTIPRLELTAAVLAVRMDLTLKAELKFQLDDSIFWTDSTSVLKYINNEDRRFQTFVANRIATIREATKPSQWRHVRTTDNPADDASRGLKVEHFLKNDRWLKGPAFLWKTEEEWPKFALDMSVGFNDPEVKREVTANAISLNIANPTYQFIVYFSDWRRLKTSVAWFLRLKAVLLQRIKQKGQRTEPVASDEQGADKGSSGVRAQTVVTSPCALTVDELSQAEVAIIRYCQQLRFQEEITALSSPRSTVSRHSSIYKLDPVLEDGLLRVGGRLSKGAMPEDAKHPFILSKDQHISGLILKHVHSAVGHSGRSHTLSAVRKRFWITKANSAVRKIISNCSFCRRYNGRAIDQKMADLPRVRIIPDMPPFTNTGVDYFGPIEIKRGRSTCKRYGVIFTCLTSRAVHLELAVSLETDACINALRRFISRRGQVVTMISDNGTNFHGAEKELKQAVAALNHAQVQRNLSQVGINWSFNPPSASHHGGVWERMIRLIRKVLSSVLRQQTLDEDGLHTVLCEVEAILNDRPVTQLSDDPCDLEPLTPNHLLLLKGKPALPPGVFGPHDLYVKKRWRQVQYLADIFWKRWVREYLPLLQERQKWNQKKRNLTIGDIVVVMDAAAPRGSWPLGRVLEVFPDKWGHVRSVKLQTKSNTIERPISKLCLVQEVQ